MTLADANPGSRRIYSGRSMRGTFKPGDNLHLEAIPFSELKAGDIVVVKSPSANLSDQQLVHRLVISAGNRSLSRGDGNPRNDEDPVTEKTYVGRVSHYERNGKIHKARNGKPGWLQARILHGRLHVVRALTFLFRKPYRRIRETGIVAMIWRPEIETISFATPDGPLLKYVHKGKTVASCWTGSNRWWFKRPYDFVIDPQRKKR